MIAQKKLVKGCRLHFSHFGVLGNIYTFHQCSYIRVRVSCFFFWELEEFEKKKNSLQVECMFERMSLEFVYYLIDFAVVIYNTTLLFCPPDP